MYITKIKEKFQNEFGQNWCTDLYNAPDSNYDSIKTSISSKLNSFAIDFFEAINLSVISGEYIVDTTFIDNLDSLLSLIFNIATLDTDNIDVNVIGKENVNALNTLVINSFRPHLMNAINHYKGLNKQVLRQSTVFDTQVILDAFKNERSEYTSSEFSTLISQTNDFISLNVKLAHIDHNLSVNPDILRELVLINISLIDKVNQSPSFYNILLDKCEFLKKKLIYRFNEDKKNYTYSFNFENIDLSTGKNEFKYFNEFYSITNLNHNLDNANNTECKKEFDRKVESALKKIATNQTIQFEDFHYLVKYYKDENKNEVKLNNLYEQFKALELPNSTNLIDKRAYQISSNYLFNNTVSFISKKDNISLEILNTYTSDLKFIQEQTKVFNYFPYLRICESLLKKIDLLLKPSINNNESLSDVKKILSLLEDLEKILYQNYEWCRNRNFQAFQVPLIECQKTVEGVTVFLSSSFILPINYAQVNKDILLVTSQILKYKTIYDYKFDINEDKEEINRIKDSINKTEKRSIEIISIFAAIVLFVSGSIQLFAKVESFKQSLLFMLVFAYALSVFVLLIWIITRENGFKYKKMPNIHRWLIAIVGVATIGSFILIQCNTNFQTVTQKSITNLKDSIKINILQDSLKKLKNKEEIDAFKPITNLSDSIKKPFSKVALKNKQ